MEQLAFEIDAVLELGNFLYMLYREPEMLERSRTAVRDAIDRRSSRSRREDHRVDGRESGS